ncbi:MAG: O-antigen ligase family protein [Bacteroidia bacterium]|nr:O-antigen ligase family protein [Bacteroidia bacterium]MBT8310082.1 O-antigen ligase family protein [Bacteroidia bacterium]NND10083.1 O-antigen ligase family protein [Flavobacteriaceae bacterium]NNL59808.1 O-antigen ligase family protein [Flavobacteriaceae bacterium]
MGKLHFSYFQLVLIHIVIGITIYLFESLSKYYFLLVTAYFFILIMQVPHRKKSRNVLIICSFIVGCEVFLRMTGGNLLYEISKYSVIGFLLLGLVFNSLSKNSYMYVIYLLLLVPGIVMASVTLDYETVFRKAIAFNLSGPVCLGLAALFCYNRSLHKADFNVITQAMVLPIISNTVYLYLYNPDIKDVLSGTQSNFEASGGFGPNQVATVLGLGMFLLVVRFVKFSNNSFQKVLNLTLLALVSYRAIITFSRGGVLTAIVIIIAFYGFYFLESSIKQKRQLLFSMASIIILAAAVWVFTSVQTLGFIDKRYANQDAAGRVKDDITTGRVELLASEFQDFFSNPFFGVGVGKIKELRLERLGINAASHNEMSRILAEHGIFGVFAFLILLFVPLVYRSKNKKNYLFYSFYLFWFLTINHSSMRIAAPAFIYGLCLLNLSDEKISLLRQQVIQKG